MIDEKDDHLVRVAMELGAEPIEPELVNPHFAKAKDVKTVIGDGRINFFPDLEKVKFESLNEKTFLIWGVKIVPGFDSRFGTSDLCLLVIETVDGKKLTTAASGVAIKKQVNAFKVACTWPIRVKLIKESNTDKPGQDYWLFV